jgi:uncharacterized protein (DUF1697 family)
MRYVALLRGINLGDNTKVPMAELKVSFSELGYTDIKTLLNSGNIVFDSPDNNIHSVKDTVEQKLIQRFGFPISIIIRTSEEMKSLIDEDPFKNIVVSDKTRLYVSFLSAPQKSNLKIPYKSEDEGIRILRVSDKEIISVVELSEKTGTLDLMDLLEKEFGKGLTTRNWNTVKKLI